MTDSSFRDGSHHIRHQFTTEQVRSIVTALDGAGVPVIEVSHGDGLGGSSLTYGRSTTDERVLIERRSPPRVAPRSLRCFSLESGRRTMCTPPPISASASLSRDPLHGGRHLTSAFRLAGGPGDGRLLDDGALAAARSAGRSSAIMSDAGCQCVYVTDSAGALILDQVSDRVGAMVAELGDDATVGFHGHENLG